MELSSIGGQLGVPYVPFSQSVREPVNSPEGAFGRLLEQAQAAASAADSAEEDVSPTSHFPLPTSSSSPVPRSPFPVPSSSPSSSSSLTPRIDRTDKLYEQCEALETFLVKNLIKSMRSTIQKTNLIDTGFAGEMYEDMLYDEYAKDFTRNAKLGFAEMAYVELTGQRGKEFKIKTT